MTDTAPLQTATHDRTTGAPLRVALVTPRYEPYIGGVETHVARLATSLAERGHEVEVLTQRTTAGTASDETRHGVRVRRFDGVMRDTPYPVPFGTWRALLRDGRRFDVVHAHAYHALSALAAPFACSRGTAFVVTPHYHAVGHTPLARALHPLYRPLGKWLMQAAEHVICVSSAEAALVGRDFGAGVAARSVTIPNAVDVRGIAAAEPFTLPYRVVLAAGRLAPYKNVSRLVEAAPLLPSDTRVVVVGDGPERPALHELARRHGVEDRVSFTGRVGDDELRRWYKTAAVAVQMSEQEAFGIVLLEALAAGARVVASAIPAHEDVVRLVSARDVSFLSPTASSDALGASVCEALDASRTGAAGEIPSWEMVAARTEHIYHAALAARHTAARPSGR